MIAAMIPRARLKHAFETLIFETRFVPRDLKDLLGRNTVSQNISGRDD